MKLTFWLETNKVGSRAATVIDIDDDEWAEMTDAERHTYVQEQLSGVRMTFARELFLDVALSRLGDWDWKETGQ